jgi:hypothetical protein
MHPDRFNCAGRCSARGASGHQAVAPGHLSIPASSVLSMNKSMLGVVGALDAATGECISAGK